MRIPSFHRIFCVFVTIIGSKQASYYISDCDRQAEYILLINRGFDELF